MKCPNCGKKMSVVDRDSKIKYSCKCGANSPQKPMVEISWVRRSTDYGRERGGKMDKKELEEREARRLAIESKLMDYLNDKKAHFLRVFDCGKLGTLHIWFDGYWNRKWYQPEPLPSSLRGE